MHWAKLKSQAKYSLSASGVLDYPLRELGVSIEDLEINGVTIYGYEPLQRALAEKSGVDTNCVAAATGTSMANHLVMATVLNPGDEVLIESPTYEPILAVARYLRAQIKRFNRDSADGFQIDPNKIREQLSSKTKLIVLTNLHNPSGVLTSQQTLRQVGELAKAVGARVLVDEVYLECTFPVSGSNYSAFHLGNDFVTTNSLTKAYGLSGLRCGWILAEPELIAQMWRLNDLFSATPPHIPELLSVIALKKLPQIARRAQDLLSTNRAILEQTLRTVNNAVEVVWPDYGTIVFPRLKHGNAAEFARVLRERYETSVVPGSFFEYPDHFRVGIGGVTQEVEKGLGNLSKALSEL